MSTLRDNVRYRTEEIHRYVEKSPMMSGIINSCFNTEGYLPYLVDIKDIYRTLESLIVKAKIPLDIVGHSESVQLDYDELSELAELVSTNSQCSIPCRSYITYLNTLTDPVRIVAHIYVRVLADLSGGKIIKLKLTKAKYPTRTYDFDVKVKDQIIDYINTQIPPELHERFIGECHLSFLSYSGILGGVGLPPQI